MGEIVQLSGWPAPIDVHARTEDGLPVITPEWLPAQLVAAATLGELIARALILRRVELLETGVGGLVILGRMTSGHIPRP